MNNTISFHSAPHAPQITVDVNILTMRKQAASCLSEMASENVYLAAIGPDMELTIIICNELFTWADVYDTANHDERRAILQQFIKEIRVRKDYEISITLNASFDQVEQLKAVSTYDGAEIFEEISEKGA